MVVGIPAYGIRWLHADFNLRVMSSDPQFNDMFRCLVVIAAPLTSLPVSVCRINS